MKSLSLCIFHLIFTVGVLLAIEKKSFIPPLSYKIAMEKANFCLQQLTLDEKLKLIGGENSFFIHGLEGFGFPKLYMADATQGVHIRTGFRGKNFDIKPMEKSTAFPCPILLASTWNPELAYQYAKAVGEECRAGGVAILLGPGLNLYRNSQCGRNFEYFGEDPYLISKMIENYVVGVQSTGTIATLKHFVTNNTEFYRRRSNSIVDERTLHEIYTRGFKAGIDAGAMAVMTSYNLVNGEWAGQNKFVINDLLRNQLGFKWLVMTDWHSVWDGEKVILSGQDLEMPEAKATLQAKSLIKQGKISEEDIDRMARSILTTIFAMNLYDRPLVDKTYYQKFPEHVEIALQTAREGIVLLKNQDILPLERESLKKILVTGKFVTEIASGGGAAKVEGYDHVTLLDALKQEFGDKIVYEAEPTEKALKSADVVLVNTGTFDSEGWDRPFDLPENENAFIFQCLSNNPNSIVIVHSGGGINMSPWHEKAQAILYSWYKGQIGNVALAEILSGKTNPSGKLPITIEKRFEDSPAYGYIPEGETLYTNWPGQHEYEHPVYDVEYKEGIFVGYRWYDEKGIEPLFPFGHGLSYTRFQYSDLIIPKKKVKTGEPVLLTLQVKNIGNREGAEIVQLYVQDDMASVPRPPKELKGFAKVWLKPGESKLINFTLDNDAFAFWHPERKAWTVEPGTFTLLLGASSRDIRLQGQIELIE